MKWLEQRRRQRKRDRMAASHLPPPPPLSDEESGRRLIELLRLAENVNRGKSLPPHPAPEMRSVKAMIEAQNRLG
ncbi:MAG: hypothetical protein ACYDGN_18165 [Acidimicrobiales bacterium]